MSGPFDPTLILRWAPRPVVCVVTFWVTAVATLLDLIEHHWLDAFDGAVFALVIAVCWAYAIELRKVHAALSAIDVGGDR